MAVYRNTKPEVLVQDWLRRARIEFRTHCEIEGARNFGIFHQFDIVIDYLETVIEVDGCYWHGHGCSVDLAPGVERQRSRDRIIDIIVGRLGWKMIRRWECEILTNPNCIARSEIRCEHTDEVFMSCPACVYRLERPRITTTEVLTTIEVKSEFEPPRDKHLDILHHEISALLRRKSFLSRSSRKHPRATLEEAKVVEELRAQIKYKRALFKRIRRMKNK